jgi:hypothetical protein
MEYRTIAPFEHILWLDYNAKSVTQVMSLKIKKSFGRAIATVIVCLASLCLFYIVYLKIKILITLLK